jgi:hypothetical protein
MARKPNYAFERNSRAKAKTEKREAKRLAKLAAKGGTGEVDGETADEAQPVDEVTEDNEQQAAD